VSKILIFDEICRNCRNSGFVAKLLTKFAFFDKRKMTFLMAKSGGDLEKALSHKFLTM